MDSVVSSTGALTYRPPTLPRRQRFEEAAAPERLPYAFGEFVGVMGMIISVLIAGGGPIAGLAIEKLDTSIRALIVIGSVVYGALSYWFSWGIYHRKRTAIIVLLSGQVFGFIGNILLSVIRLSPAAGDTDNSMLAGALIGAFFGVPQFVYFWKRFREFDPR